MAGSRSEFRPDLAIFGVPKRDPGWIYLIQNDEFYKIGKTRNPQKRLYGEAKTWLPNMKIIALKPFWNISKIENALQTAFTWHWHAGEWFRFRSNENRDFLIDGLKDFWSDDRDKNSVDFIYWMNGSGMAEFTLERSRNGLTLPQWHRRERERSAK
jgi:hypothetical protein